MQLRGQYFTQSRWHAFSRTQKHSSTWSLQRAWKKSSRFSTPPSIKKSQAPLLNSSRITFARYAIKVDLHPPPYKCNPTFDYTLKDIQLEHHTPTDWSPNPSILSRISDPACAQMASELNCRWRDLCRKTNKSVLDYPDRSRHIDIQKINSTSSWYYTNYN